MAYEPFYIANQQMGEDWEAQEEQDFEYMKEMYPQSAKEIQAKVEEECDKLEYDGSIMFDEYPDKTLIRAICDRIYDQLKENQPTFYVEDEVEIEPESVSNILTAENQCRNCGRPPQRPDFPPPRPPQRPGFPPPRPPQGPGFPPPRPPQRPGFPPSRPPQRPNFPQPCSRPGCTQRGWLFTQSEEENMCVPGRPKRDCFTAMQTSQDWQRDMIQVLLYNEMHRRRHRRRRRKNRRNY